MKQYTSEQTRGNIKDWNKALNKRGVLINDASCLEGSH